MLRHNARGPCHGLPRTAGWGYPEPYTRDLMISALGALVSGDDVLVDAVRRTLEALARHQTAHGHIPSLAHDPGDLGASDTTPLFLFGLGLYRLAVDEPGFLDEAARKALTWLRYQSPDDQVMVAQLPTSDWRDEQVVFGYGLYVNTVVYSCLRLMGKNEDARTLRGLMNRLHVRGDRKHPHVHEGLVVPHKPYFALYSYKVYHNERFDLLGNSLAILSGIASPSRGERLIAWIEAEMRGLQDKRAARRRPAPVPVPVHPAGGPRLDAALRAVQPPRRVPQRRRVAVRLRILRGGVRGCGQDAPGRREAGGVDAAGEPVARARAASGASTSGSRRRRASRAAATGRRGPRRCTSTRRLPSSAGTTPFFDRVRSAPR